MILELAGGTGELAAALAPRVAQVIYTDFSPAMVDVARRRGIPGVEHRVLDMQAIDLPDASVDGVLCRYGYMLVPDPALAMRETRRVLRPGGRVALATWAGAKNNPWATRYGPVLIERGLMEPPPPGAPGQFALGEPEQIESLARGAGFTDSTWRRSPIEFRFPDWDDYRRVVTSLAASLRETLAGLDEPTRAEVDEAARARFEPFAAESGYMLPGRGACRPRQLENCLAQCARDELDGELGGGVLAVEDRVHLDDLERAGEPRLGDELEREVRLAVGEPAAHRRADARRDLRIERVHVQRHVDEAGPGDVGQRLADRSLDPDPVDVAHRVGLDPELADPLALARVDRTQSRRGRRGEDRPPAASSARCRSGRP